MKFVWHRYYTTFFSFCKYIFLFFLLIFLLIPIGNTMLYLKGGGGTKEGHGKKTDQKMKPFLVYEYLMRNSDENHLVTVNEMVGYLQECGISAERRSIYTDIRRCLTVASFLH